MKPLLDTFSLIEAARLQPDDKSRLADISIPRAEEWAAYFEKEVRAVPQLWLN